jgi:hypothetical protein
MIAYEDRDNGICQQMPGIAGRQVVYLLNIILFQCPSSPYILPFVSAVLSPAFIMTVRLIAFFKRLPAISFEDFDRLW